MNHNILTSNYWPSARIHFPLKLSNEFITCYFGKGLQRKVKIQWSNFPFYSKLACFNLNFTGNYTATKRWAILVFLEIFIKSLWFISHATAWTVLSQAHKKNLITFNCFFHQASCTLKIRYWSLKNELIFNNWRKARTCWSKFHLCDKPLLAPSYLDKIEHDIKRALFPFIDRNSGRFF